MTAAMLSRRGLILGAPFASIAGMGAYRQATRLVLDRATHGSWDSTTPTPSVMRIGSVLIEGIAQ